MGKVQILAVLTMEEKEELVIDGKQVHVLPTWEWMLREK